MIKPNFFIDKSLALLFLKNSNVKLTDSFECSRLFNGPGKWGGKFSFDYGLSFASLCPS